MPLISHMGMHKTLELVDRQFHWRRLRGDMIQILEDLPYVSNDEIRQLRQRPGYCSRWKFPQGNGLM